MIFFDAHVHLYSEFELDVLLTAFASHADIFAREADALVMAVMLRGFQTSLETVLAPFMARDLRGWKLEKGPESSFVATDSSHRIFLLPARQVAAKERIEALGLFGEAEIPDGLPLQETIGRLRAAGFQPILAWGLGKWLFKRAPIVAGALDVAAGEGMPLPVGDSALRPTFWPTPRLYKKALALGGRILYGSDPLPRMGDEYSAGCYATRIDAPFDAEAPATCLLSTLHSAPLSPFGRRHGLGGTLRRLR